MNERTLSQLSDVLRFAPEEGHIWLKDYRMIMLSACACGTLRKELIDTLGWQAARSLLKRFGYASGLADAVALAERFPQASDALQMDLGPEMHALEGIATVRRIEELCDVDLENGRYHVEAYWENSFEAEQHLELIGPAEEPVCWTLVGYAAGHSSAVAGSRVVVRETECRAMGAEHCRFVATLAGEDPVNEQRELLDYRAEHFPSVLQELHETIQQQQETIESRQREIDRLESEVERIRSSGNLVGESAALMRTLETARSAAPYSATVLILGESGTGKELLARFVHDHSDRSQKPFLAVNCSALPETLQEAELFGHAKGAFTGATGARAGVFEAADGGTLFLDEVGDLTPSAQTKMLRALQEGEVKRIGESTVRRVNVRIVAATNKDLEAEVRSGAFREDLFYRLSVVPITLPPLRDRGADRLLLARHFLALYARRFDKPVSGLSTAAARLISEYSWPGNVRELENALQRAVILAKGDTIEAEDLPPALHGRSISKAPAGTTEAGSPHLPEELDERGRIEWALERADGRREEAAARLGISRTTLWRRIKELGLDSDH